MPNIKDLIADIACGICHALRPETLGDLEGAAERIKVLELLLEKAQAHIIMPEKPALPMFEINLTDMLKICQDTGLTWMNLNIPQDSFFYASTEEGWEVALEWLKQYKDWRGELWFDPKWYVPQKNDCENYGLQAQEICARELGLNALRVVNGDCPLGNHGYDIVPIMDDAGVYKLTKLFEPNLGFADMAIPYAWQLMNIGDRGYVPRSVFF